MTDYIASPSGPHPNRRHRPWHRRRLLAATGTALVGGETAEHPACSARDDYDVAGAATGVVEADAARAGAGAGWRRPGRARLVWAALQRVLAGAARHRCRDGRYDRHVAIRHHLGRGLLEPTRLYTLACLALAAARRRTCTPSATSPAAGSRRTSPACCRGACRGSRSRDLDRRPSSTWSRPRGRPVGDLEGTLNLGVGMVAVVAPEASTPRRRLARQGCRRGCSALSGRPTAAGRGRGRRPRRQGRHGGAVRTWASTPARRQWETRSPAPPGGWRRDGVGAQRPPDEVQAPYSSSSSLSVSSGAGGLQRLSPQLALQRS